ncbi:Outer membrane protein Imp, required for envelope biogenesis / Organic solvent tolerance protein precursor [hydrothermal vent metagenome]|uniref:Outer membrane protein Imp, required for envelope biogenesis / Organic solvent tolerance protein n=1 Tax=hydrothermal vent metagenome TaxID=652676 RepID=A0A1W1CVB4_9ZZZZ
MFSILLYASPQTDKIEVTAKSIRSTKTSVYAKEGVSVYYNNAVIKADSALYDKSKKLLILDGNIEVIGYKGTKEHTKHLEINTQTKEVSFDELFLVSKDDIWIFSKSGYKKKNTYTLGKSVLSSCEIDNPLWKMVFSKSTYNRKDKYIKIYDAKVYMGDIPVFYSPYFAFSTNKQRSSGLLFPTFGYSELEGFLYEQPIYWAVSESMDIEFNPQIRTNRSLGIYSTLRFVDTADSFGTLRLGYFKDKVDYANTQHLKNDSHFGLEFNYQSSKVLPAYLSQDFVDGLYINSTFLNDIDYLNLQKSSLEHFGLTPLQESRLNYFAQNNNYYIGLNAKYFIDIRDDVDQDKTLQVLPSLQFHKYLDSLIVDNLTYSADFKINNFERKKGTTMKQAEFRLPLELSTAFFDDFLNISAGETFYYSKFFFDNKHFSYNEFEYYSTIHHLKIFTDLTKKFDNFVHVLQPSLSYIKPGTESQKPVDFSELDIKQKELFVVGLPEEQYVFSLSQYLYNEDMSLKFYQRLTQKYYLNRDYKFADMSNEIEYRWDKLWTVYNRIIYSHEYKKIRESSTHITYSDVLYALSIGHTFTDVLPDNKDAIASNDIDLSFTYTYNDKLFFQGDLTYNLDNGSSKQWQFGGTYHCDCWSISSSFRQNITPRPTGSTVDTAFYVQLNFIPFGSVGTGN